MALITNDDPLLADLDYSNKSTAQKAQIDALIEVCSDLIEKYCNRIFLAADYTDEKHNGNRDNSIFVKNPPINSLSQISIAGEEDTNLDFDDEIFEYDVGSGEVWWKSLILLSSISVIDYIGYYPNGRNNVLITYNGGFSEIPGGIKLACVDMVKAAFSPEMGFGNIEFEKLGQYFYKLRKEQIDRTLLGHRRILRMYKIFRV